MRASFIAANDAPAWIKVFMIIAFVFLSVMMIVLAMIISAWRLLR